MRILKLLFISFILLILGSCIREEVVYHNVYEEPTVSLYNLVERYDLWYVDIHNKLGDAEVPFLQRAFTIRFDNGQMYGNNNIVNVGNTGNGYGIKIGTFRTSEDVLETEYHEGVSDFRVVQLSDNEIRLDDINQNVSYSLVGYMIDDFDYDKLFYDNIEYFLQEYAGWEQVEIKNGVPNPFDDEHYLNFTSDNDNVFYSSGDDFGTTIDSIFWDYVGDYIIENYEDSNIKRLTLYYNNNNTEVFDLIVIDDETIRLNHLETGTDYYFEGIGFIQYLRPGKGVTPKKKTQNNNRKRRKIKRKSIKRT